MSENPLRQLQLKELSLLKLFQQICKDNNITYYALGGTLLGAIRHKGFIPWDDDIDVGIPRPDYERLCRIFESGTLNGSIQFRTFRKTEDYIRYFGRLEDESMKIVRHDNIKVEEAFAWIDLFPLDAMPNNALLRKIKVYQVLFLRAIYRFSCFDRLVNVNKKGRPLHERILVWIGLHTPVQKFFNTRKCLERLERALTSTPYEKSEYLVNAMGAYKFREMFHKKYYGKGKMYPFEDTEICGPEDYDFVCTQLYGDYMTPPKMDDRNHHGLQAVGDSCTNKTVEE
ncbi:MAG: LicD family protein [Fibrobacter sp.]|nr:LicD family protein [Fibrobacter sp.]